MIDRSRMLLAISLLVAILAMVALAAGLSQVELSQGTMFEPDILNELRGLLGQFGRFRNMFIVFLIVCFIYVMFHFRRSRQMGALARAPRKRPSLLVTMLQIVLWAIALLIIRSRLAESSFQFVGSSAVVAPSFSTPGPIPEISTNIPEWFSFSFSLAIFVLVILGAWWFLHRRKKTANPLEQVAQEAQFALEDLQSGADLRNVILRCYYDMGQAVRSQRGIRRSRDMTAREFETRLIDLGLPSESVHQLTRLFESVRYGDKTPSETTERQAMACLKAIVDASLEMV